MHRVWAWLAPTVFACCVPVVGQTAEITVSPPAIILDRPEASQQLLVTGFADGRREIDLTRRASYAIAEPGIAAIDERGRLVPLREGRSTLQVRCGDACVEVPVEVTGLEHPHPISFEHDIIPVLTKSRCNSGGCHGKAEGQNGFKLSVFGFDPAADYDALAKETRRRRIFPLAPEQSLLLRKATSDEPHGGGRKMEKHGLHYRRLVRWISEGMRYQDDAVPLVEIVLEPPERSLLAGETQQLQVTAVDARGVRRCVTSEAEYESNAETVAHIDRQGLIAAGDVPGEAAILVRYMGHVAVSRITHPRPCVEFLRPAEENFIDRLVWDKLQRLGIEPSGPCDDATFLRRAYLDTIGTLPTTDEGRAFLDDRDPHKRPRLVDQLLARDEYADYWAMLWADILRVDRDRLSAEGAVAMTRWLRQQFAENRRYDEFVREILTARGDTLTVGPAGFYKVLDQPEELSRSISQLFLGVRIACAQCHHHPFERWGQDDYVGLAGFFTGVSRKGLPGGSQAILAVTSSDLNHPRTGQIVAARALGAAPADFTGVNDRREVLAAWMTSRDNPYFARALSNRLWAHYFGRGLVEPVDDLRATNPATNEPLLDALANHLHDVNFDLKAFARTLLCSRAYQLSGETTVSNADDFQNFSHAHERPLPAEVLLDAISQATGVPEKFNGWPVGYRAIQIWDNRLPSYFFQIFGRPVRASVCECERSNDPNIAQALHLMNSPEILGKIQSPNGRAAQLAQSDKPTSTIIDELCLAALARFPTTAEQDLFEAAFSDGSDRRHATEDVLWTLLNSKEFLFNH